ncbi:MAG: YfhO family protein [Candidatus Eisenbacteria sp.]|nr:YfhO family protein [Candidatus Eisenbacteria bacterium]
MRRRLSAILLPYGLLLILVAIFYWKALFLGELFLTNDIAGSDMMMHSYPARAELAAGLREGRLPLWTDNLFLGFPVAAEGQVGTFYPLNLLFFLLLPVDRAYTILMVLHVVLAGCFTALFARSLGRSRSAALLAGVVLALSGFMVTHLKHVNLIGAAAWLPLGFWLVERWSRRTGNWRMGIWLGIVVALGIVAGHVQSAYFGLLVLGFYLMVASVGERAWTPVRRGLAVGLLMVVVAAGLSAVQTFLSYEYTCLGTRSEGMTYEEATEFDFRLEDLVMYVDPYHFGDPGRATYYATGEVQRLFWENCGYVGILPLVLALVGAIACWRRRRVKFLIGLGVLSILLVLGKGSPLYWLFYQVVPGFDRFRMPARFILFTTLSLSVLAAYGLDWFGDRLSSVPWRAALGKGAAIVISVISLFAFGYTHNPTLPAELWLTEPDSVRFLKKDSSRYRVWSPDAHLLYLEAYREADGWKGDLTPYLEQRNALQPNFNGLFGVQSLGVYFPVVPRLFLSDATGLDLEIPKLKRMLDLYNVKYLLVGGEIRDPQIVLRTRSPGNVKIYENPGVLPRVRIVGMGIPVVSPEHALSVIHRPEFDPERMVTLQGWGGSMGLGLSRGSSVTEVERRGGRVELQVSMTGHGFLVLADAYYPGWEVWVDGEEHQILQANIVCRAVALRPGEHEVVFRYRPGSFTVGLVITLLSIGGVGGVVVADLMRNAG